MVLVRPSVFKNFNKQILGRGVILGLLLASGYYTQTVGLELTTAAISGFITGLYVVVTPILGWVFLKRKTSPKIVLGIALATIGLAFISINASDVFSINVSTIWLIACAVLFAAHIVGLSVWSPGQDPYALTVVQLFVVGFSTLILAMGNGYQAPPNAFVWFAVLFTAIFSTAIAFLVQTWAQGIMDASRVAIFLTTEVIFTALISVSVGQESLELKTILGGLLMLAAMLWVEWPTKNNEVFKDSALH
jgi:drug/metabolite transporter (DMT)-like permease